ncbi:hypothetical protein pb186bvf_019836 [Paramecium bursaria]
MFDIQKHLISKYSQSSDYYYQKGLSEFYNNSRKPKVILFQFQIAFNDITECLRRTYQKAESFEKLGLLTEYYKYHNEIPRLFMPNLSEVMNNYHDKKRRIEYYKIVKIIEEENRKNPQKPKKAIVGDKPEDIHNQQPKKHYGKILQDITEHSTTIEVLNRKLKTMKFPNEELELQPSNRDQDQLNQFMKFLTQKQKPMQSPPMSAKKITIRKQTQFQQFSISPRQHLTTYSKFKIEETKKPLKSGCQTHRTLKDPLNKILSPAAKAPQQLFKQSKSTHTSLKKLTISEISKQLPYSLHQHTRSDMRIFKK